MRHFITLMLLVFFVSSFFSTIKADILHVKPGTASTAWQNKTNVYSDLQTAMADAAAGDEIWVAAGTYKPTNDGDRSISFELKNNVKYYGGFSGDETKLSQRDWQQNETILSGDIGEEGDDTDNSYHVLMAKGTESSPITDKTRFDGFIIENGYANGWYENDDRDGGGLYLKYASPFIVNCHFKTNYASYAGGAIKGKSSSDAMFGNVIFTDNSAGNYGGAVYNYYDSVMEFYNCVWHGNHSNDRGGAIGGSFVKVYNSIAWNNSASLKDDDFYGSDVYCSIYKKGSSDDHNISSDPQFVDPENSDFRVRQSSPAINSGSLEGHPDWLIADFLGDPRLQNDTIDIGVFEGGVLTPAIESPVDGCFLDSGITEVMLKWDWPKTPSEDISTFELELVFDNIDTTFVSNVQQINYTLSGITSPQKIQWRVKAMDESGFENWSQRAVFATRRGHPLYVKKDATGNGTSWDNAMGLKEALEVSMFGDSLWVARGEYKPTNKGDRRISFGLKDGVKYYGGFSGDETKLSQRDWQKNETILSGDIGVEGDNTDNSYHVLTAQGTESFPISKKTKLDGFIIEKGRSNNDGGGLYMSHSSPVVSNSWFRKNFASHHGGAICAEKRSDAQLIQCVFEKNKAERLGGAIASFDSFIESFNCVWYSNRSEGAGGAVEARSGNMEIYNSIAWRNSAGNSGDNFFSGEELFNTITENPQFHNAERSDFRLRTGSPAINAGSIENLPDWVIADFSGNIRIQEDTINLGVFEGYIETPLTKSPEDYVALDPENKGVTLSWHWNIEVPENVACYDLKYVVNGDDTTLVSGIQDLSYALTGLNPLDEVSWRVCSKVDNGENLWSNVGNFKVSRGHPLYVKKGATGSGNSWNHAIGLIDALEMAEEYDSIWVAKGTYKPSDTNDRDVSFKVDKNVNIYGGFKGDETTFGERDWIKNKTILSGDIGVEGDSLDNSYHVIWIEGTSKSPITKSCQLNGFVIENGYASGSINDGGGLFLYRASPYIKNCLFRNNYAEFKGGAVNCFKSYPDFGNVIFTGNISGFNGGAVEISSFNDADVDFYNCVWYDNHSRRGGAITGNDLTLIYNSIFLNNSASASDYTDNFDDAEVYNSIFGLYRSYNNNFSANPQFIDPANDDFRLRKGTPASNKGNQENIPEWLQTDFYGNARVLGDAIDIGAFEGSVITPVQTLPADEKILRADAPEVTLEWAWEDEKPANITGYEVEYIINGTDTTLVTNIQDLTHTVTGLSPLDEVSWRVCSLTDDGFKNWSGYSGYKLSRGHPIYVKSGSSGTGTSWSDAMELTGAIEEAGRGDTIWVAKGSYKPTETSDRNASFNLKDYVKIFGGFRGDETSFEERNWIKNQTILSGDIGIDGDTADNVYHVIMADASQDFPVTNTCQLDGFVIENGNANGAIFPEYNGGGIYLRTASPVISNCHFRNNHSKYDGGAAFGYDEAGALFGNVIFSDNSAEDEGGGVYYNSQSSLKFFNCVWYANESSRGGAVYGRDSKGDIYNSIAWGNKASENTADFFETNVLHSIFSDGAFIDGKNNISGDPNFLDPGNGDFRVLKGSPALNAGSPENIPDWLITDYYGKSRIQKDTIDIGIAEGGVEMPLISSPASKKVFESDVSEVPLEWGWKKSMPDDIQTYEVEYIVNGDTSTLKDLSVLTYNLTGLSPADEVTWRVAGIADLGLKSWSDYFEFTISRDHPLYVKPDGQGDGSSWLSPMDLKTAMDTAIFSDQIWVAAGTYKPTDNGDRSISFDLKKDVRLYGGFSGNESSIEERNWHLNKTILSGDIGVEGDNTDNSYHVVHGFGSSELPITETTVFDGFVVEYGNSDDDGGGLYLRHASPFVKNVWFRDNYAAKDGGAVYTDNASVPQFSQSIFDNNEAGDNGGAVASRAALDFVACVWYSNFASDRSGAIYPEYNTTVKNSIFSKNTAGNYDDNYNRSDVTCYHSISESISWRNGNIHKDPQLVDPENGNFFLQSGSPAINAGDNQYVADVLLNDFTGLNRTFGENVDIGAFEFRQTHNIAPEPGASATKDYSTLDMVNFSWGITDWVSDTTQNFPEDYKWKIKIWEDGDEASPVHDEEISTGGLMGESNNTVFGGFDFESKYYWQVGLNIGEHISWSTPTSFYIGHDHVIHVKEGSTGTTGEDWSLAFGTLHEAVDYSIPGDEIWVAKGTYYPVTPADPAQITQDEREQFLSLKPGMALYGGFAGDEISVSQRNNQENETIISGDIGVEGELSDNSIHLLRNEFNAFTPLKRGVVVDGFVLEEATGSAVSNINASPSFRYCIFRNNEGENGAGVYNENSSPYFYNVLFYGNHAISSGGAVYGDENSNPDLLNCTVAGNSADAGGGLAGYFKVRNSIVFGNAGGQIRDASDVAYSCIENGFDGAENISYDPAWRDAENHDYQLNEFSPGIDQGDGSLITGLFSFDLARNARKHNFHVDMGAYEAQSVGELEIVESPLIADEPVDFIDSLIIRFNQPVAINSDGVVNLSPSTDFTVRVSEEDSTVLVIDHPGLASSTDYQMEIPDNMVHHLKNDRIAKQENAFDFTTRECVPVTLTSDQSELSVCPRASAQIGFEIDGDLLEYDWVFNDQDTLEHSKDTLNVQSVRSGDLGSYKFVADDWCENTISSTVELQFKETEDLVIPEPKWNSVYFVDNGPGNFSDFKWYANGEVVSEKQYLDVGAKKGNKFVVTALDKASGCVVYSDTIRYSGEGLKSANITPNPVQSGNPVSIQLPEVSGNSEIRLYNMAGNLLERKFFDKGSQLKFENTRFQTGVYLLRLEYSDGRVEERKLIID